MWIIPASAPAIMDLLEKIDLIPPCMCRLMARSHNGRRGLSTREIAKRSGIPKSTVAELSLLNTWRGQRIERIDAFANACGVDLFVPCKVRSWAKHAKKPHIKNAPLKRKKMFQKIFKLGAH